VILTDISWLMGIAPTEMEKTNSRAVLDYEVKVEERSTDHPWMLRTATQPISLVKQQYHILSLLEPFP
jgi:hypothetical protein